MLYRTVLRNIDNHCLYSVVTVELLSSSSLTVIFQPPNPQTEILATGLTQRIIFHCTAFSPASLRTNHHRPRKYGPEGQLFPSFFSVETRNTVRLPLFSTHKLNFTVDLASTKSKFSAIWCANLLLNSIRIVWRLELCPPPPPRLRNSYRP